MTPNQQRIAEFIGTVLATAGLIVWNRVQGDKKFKALEDKLNLLLAQITGTEDTPPEIK